MRNKRKIIKELKEKYVDMLEKLDLVTLIILID